MSNNCSEQKCGIKFTVLCLSQQDGLMTVDVTGIVATVTITIPGGGMYRYWLTLSDSNDPLLSRETANPPTSGTTVYFTGRTDADGNASFQFENNASVRTWYTWLELVKTNVSDAITVGV